MHALLLRALSRRAYSRAPEPLINSRSILAPHTGTIKLLTLNRPTAANSLSRALLKELSDHVNAIKLGEDTSTRALVIGSDVDGVFCAGADLKERAGFTKDETDQFLLTLRTTLNNLSTLPVPTISAISSLALGGGLELALATDLRIVSRAVQLALPETRLGIVPGAGGTFRLPRLVGRGRAMDMILTGRRVGASEAVQIGLVNRVVEEREGEGEGRERTIEAAVEVANEICRGGPVAVRQAVRAVKEATETAENEAYEVVVKTMDRNEALAAFREKRKPVFKGE